MLLGGQTLLHLSPGGLRRRSWLGTVLRRAKGAATGAQRVPIDRAADAAALMLSPEGFQGCPFTVGPLAGLHELEDSDRPSLMPRSEGQPHRCGRLSFAEAGVHDQRWLEAALIRTLAPHSVRHSFSFRHSFPDQLARSCLATHVARFCPIRPATSLLAMEPGDHLDQLTAGLPDSVFVTDGLLTKRALRSFALAMLAPRAGELLWDLGAGTGSIAIEWCRLHPANRAVAVERNPERAARIAVNAQQLGVAGQLEILTGTTSEVLDALPGPAAVFIGGGVQTEVVDRSWEALGSGGRLVAHSVTAESDAVLLAAQQRWPGDLNRIAVEVAEPIGRFTGFRPLRTVTTWAAVKA